MSKQFNNFYPHWKPLYFLYFFYAFFFLGAFIKKEGSAINEYVLGFVTISIIVFLLVSSADTIKISKGLYLLVLFILLFLVPTLLKGNSHYIVMLLAYIVFLIIFFSHYTISQESFVNFINVTYFIFLIFSLLIYFGVIPPIVEVDESAAANNAAFLGLSDFKILHAMDGSPANIDTYSALILLINLFINKKKSRIFFIGTSIFAIIASLRFTPIVSLIIIIALYPMYNNRFLTTAVVLFISIFFILILYTLSKENMSLFGVDIWTFLFLATHGRSMIWEQQIEIFRGFSIIDFLIGNFNPDLFSVPIMRIQGIWAEDNSFNPHNTYLLMLFRQPFIFFTLLFLFIFYQYKRHKKHVFPMIFLIFLSGFTNSGIISLGNPIYLYVLIYFLTKKQSKEERYMLN